MKQLLLIASVLLLAALVTPQNLFCPANTDPSVLPMARNLEGCKWYNQNSCCSVSDSQKINAAYNGVGNVLGNFTIPEWVKGIFAPCLDQIHLLVWFVLFIFL